MRVKIVPDMTYNVFGGTLNPTLLLHESIRVSITCRLLIVVLDVALVFQSQQV